MQASADNELKARQNASSTILGEKILSSSLNAAVQLYKISMSSYLIMCILLKQ
jgi:hypothetical protein